MARIRFASLILAGALLGGLTGCGPAPTPASPSPTPTRPAEPSVTLWFHAAIIECASMGGCAAEVAIARTGEPAPDPFTNVAGLGRSFVDGRPPLAQGLPARIQPGSWTVWLRHLARSDDIMVGMPESRTTIAECEVSFEATAGQVVRIDARFGVESCWATAEIEGG